MEYFDVGQIVDAVELGFVHGDWTVFRMTPKNFTRAGTFLIGAVILNTALLVWVIHSEGFDGGAGCAGLAVLFCLTLMIYCFTQVSHAHEYWLAVTPTGFVEQWGKRGKISLSVAFAQYSSISLTVHKPLSEGPGASWVTLALIASATPDGKRARRRDWTVSKHYNTPPERIAQTIVEAYTRYTATHAIHE